MPTDLSTLDLATINAAQSVIVATLRSKCCQWEQDSADATASATICSGVVAAKNSWQISGSPSTWWQR